MPNFAVVITERLLKSVIVEAEDENQAFWKVRNAWMNGIHVLDAKDFAGVEFETIPCDENGDFDFVDTIKKYDEKGNSFPYFKSS